MDESTTTLLACNKRYVISAQDDRVQTRRTNETLTLLKPDYLGHKGAITHLAIHQTDHCFGTQDDWGRVVASSDVTNRVKVWLCDGEEEELMFARNMAEYVGYELVTALAWTADSKVAIGDVAGNFIVFNARYATSRYNRTVAKAITAIAPSQNDPHIHAVGYQDGSILLIRTNPTFQILFTNPVAHTAPIVSLAWRPEFSAARTYTEKDGKVHKSSAEDMTLLASCPATKGEFRIWAWSSKSEKLNGFRDEKKDGVGAGEPRPENGLQWSRNGKVVQFIEGEVQVWDVKKLQIQSELFLPSSHETQGIAVDGHRGIIYTLSPEGVEKHAVPTKSATQNPAPTPNLQAPLPASPTSQVTTPLEPPKSVILPSPSPEPSIELTPATSPTPSPAKPSPPLPTERTSISTDASIDSLTSRVKLMARQFDEDPNLNRRKNSNNFIANAKAKYTVDRRKRTVSNENDLTFLRAKSPEPGSRPSSRAESTGESRAESRLGSSGHDALAESKLGPRKSSIGSIGPDSLSESRIAMRKSSIGSNGPDSLTESKIGLRKPSFGSSGATKGPSLFDFATSRISGVEPSRPIARSGDSKIPTLASSNSREQLAAKKTVAPEDRKPAVAAPVAEEKLPPSPQPSPPLKPIDRTIRQPSTIPLAVTIPEPAKPATLAKDVPPVPEKTGIPIMKRRDSEVEFLESPVLGEMLTSNFPVISPAAMPVTTLETFPTITSGELSTILEETAARDAKRSGSTPPLEIVKPPTPKTEMPASLQRPTPPPKEPFTAQPLPMAQNNSIQSIKSPTSSSSSLKVAGQSSSFEDLGGISMDDHDPHADARSDTSVESMHSAIEDFHDPISTPKQIIIIPDLSSPPSTPAAEPIPSTPSSPVAVKPSRASMIFAQRSGQNIHTSIVTYVSDGEDITPSPGLKGETETMSEEEPALDSPTPYRNSLKDYDLFRSLTKKMAQVDKDQLEIVLSTNLTQFTVCKAFFGYENVSKLVEEELQYAKQANIGLTELVLKLWMGSNIEDEDLLKTILFGKTNGLAESLVISLAPLGIISAFLLLTAAGLEVWESLMLWCTEAPGHKFEPPQEDVIKGNQLVRTHIYAAFLYYNGSWREAVEIYRKAKMYREAILMALMAMSVEDREGERMVGTIKDLFPSWGDQLASRNGNGVLVSMCFGASMITYDPTAKPRRVHYEPQSSTRSPSPDDIILPRKPAARERSREQSPISPVIPIIRTQKPSPTDVPSNPKAHRPRPSPHSTLQPQGGRNWAELATFMRTQKEKGYQAIRTPKQVHFQNDSPVSSANSSPSLPLPVLPKSRSRPASPIGRPVPTRRYTDDEDWSESVKRRDHLNDKERPHSPSTRRPSLPSSKLSTAYEPRRIPDVASPLSFGARGASIKPQSPEPPPVPIKSGGRDRAKLDEKENRRAFLEGEKGLLADANGVGLGIQGMRERTRV